MFSSMIVPLLPLFAERVVLGCVGDRNSDAHPFHSEVFSHVISQISHVRLADILLCGVCKDSKRRRARLLWKSKKARKNRKVFH